MINIKRKFQAVIIFASVFLLVISITTDVFSSQPKTIILDPGHGGIDGGCIGGELLEKDITLDISRMVQSLLQQKGYIVKLTRDSDISLYKLCNIGKTMPQRDLNERVNRINNSEADLFVSIHVNSFVEDTRINGSTVYFYNHQCVQSKKLAELVQQKLNGIIHEGVKRTSHNSRPNDFFILKKTAMPGVLVETGFLSSTLEMRWFASEGYRLKIAEAISAGIDSYFND